MSSSLLSSGSVSTGAVARRGQVLKAMQPARVFYSTTSANVLSVDLHPSFLGRQNVCKEVKEESKLSNQGLVGFDDYSKQTLLCFKYCRNQVKDISVVTCKRQK